MQQVTGDEIRAVQAKFEVWLARQAEPVRRCGGMIVMGLLAAQVGRPHPKIIERLAEDVEKLRRAKADASQLLCD